MSLPTILLLSGLTAQYEEQLAKRGRLVRAITAEARRQAIAQEGSEVEIVLTAGVSGLSKDEMDLLPRLRLICCVGVGYESIDVEHARSRGVAVSYGPHTNADSVADHAFGLTLAVVRRLVPGHEAACRGIERNRLPVPDQLHGKKLGLFGLGEIGSRVARRANGFDVEVGYHSRHRREGSSYRYFNHLVDLAAWCDVLVLAAPGSPETARVVNVSVLEALGPSGYLINVARGSLVDEVALAEALRHKRIKGAALDVYDSEPHAPQVLLDGTEILLSPHLGGRSVEAMRNMAELVLRNIDSFVAGHGVVTPVPFTPPSRMHTH